MSKVLEHVETAVDAGLLIVATCIVFIPELRGPAMQIALYLFGMVGAVLFVSKLHASGMLGLTPKGIFRSPRRPHVSLLSTAATLMSLPALVIITLQ